MISDSIKEMKKQVRIPFNSQNEIISGIVTHIDKSNTEFIYEGSDFKEANPKNMDYRITIELMNISTEDVEYLPMKNQTIISKYNPTTFYPIIPESVVKKAETYKVVFNYAALNNAFSFYDMVKESWEKLDSSYSVKYIWELIKGSNIQINDGIIVDNVILTDDLTITKPTKDINIELLDSAFDIFNEYISEDNSVCLYADSYSANNIEYEIYGPDIDILRNGRIVYINGINENFEI